GPQLTADHVEAGGLAGAVRSDQRQELAAADREADTVYGAHAAERFGEAADRKHRHRDFPRAAPRPLIALARDPTMPPGNMSTSTRMMAPSSARQYSVWRITLSCNVAKIAAPASGPLSDSRPPRSTITMASMERPTLMVSGEIDPLAKANNPPASPAAPPAI